MTKWISKDALERALAALAEVDLPRAGPLVPGFLALKRGGVRVNEWTNVSPTDFVETCDRLFKLPDPPNRAKPYYFPLGSSHGWRHDNWPRGTVFTRFKDTTPLVKKGKLELKGEGENWRWRLEEGYEDVLQDYVRADSRIPLLPFSIWVSRARALGDEETLDDVVTSVLASLRLSEGEASRLFDDSALGSDWEGVFGPKWELAELGATLGTPPTQAPEPEDAAEELEDEVKKALPPVPGDSELVENLVERISSDFNFDATGAHIGNVLLALRSDRFVVLEGRPGTGKTSFVQAFVKSLDQILAGRAAHILIVPVSEQTAEHDIIGYRDLAGAYVPSNLMLDLHAGDPDNDLYFVLLDEANLAPIDVYGAGLISAVTNRLPLTLPGSSELDWAKGPWRPPVGTFVIATINSHLEDPSRLRLSVPLKRRVNVIRMPDRLADIVAAGDNDEAQQRFVNACRTLLAQVADRRKHDGANALDGDAIEALRDDIPIEATDVLWRISRALAPLPEVPMTMGVLQSMLTYIQLGPYADLATAIDLQVEQKLLPLMRGPVENLEALEASLPDSAERSRRAIARARELALLNAGTIRPSV